MNILITGATGFLGSNIAKSLIDSGYEIIATYRDTSTFEKIEDYKDRINWIKSESDSIINTIRKSKTDILIHTAWSGIDAESRNNWDIQLKNFSYSKKLIEDSIDAGIKKIIVLGSQAEYGIKGFKVTEETMPEPIDAYGAVKLTLLYFFKQLCEKEKIEWYWVRVFSVFGRNENPSWLIPNVISHLQNGEKILLTEGEQEYNYLYVEDFLDKIKRIVEETQNLSGIYNICNENTVQLKKILTTLSNIMGVSEHLLEFGTLPYREGQNMIISGSCKKFRETFHFDKPDLELKDALQKTIEIYTNR
ncbi:MAG: NAD(P)-dependent oxidoreductase [Bacteroidales bacterium]|jgi:nucleoside-diphosphate-sugar epimerase|nr:NAD(P)-dependent oxidoreductase [Bacteroidales bacterium]